MHQINQRGINYIEVFNDFNEVRHGVILSLIQFAVYGDKLNIC